jgi:hypothetical protein
MSTIPQLNRKELKFVNITLCLFQRLVLLPEPCVHLSERLWHQVECIGECFTV